jgi:hypothetical protein
MSATNWQLLCIAAAVIAAIFRTDPSPWAAAAVVIEALKGGSA